MPTTHILIIHQSKKHLPTLKQNTTMKKMILSLAMLFIAGSAMAQKPCGDKKECIIRKTKRFDFFERTAHFFRTKRTSEGYPPFQFFFDWLTPVLY